MDQALKEAIRRSLEESFPKEEVKEPVSVEKKEDVETKTKETPSSEPSPVEKKEPEVETPSPVEEEKDIVNEKVVSRTPSDVESEKKDDTKPQEDAESISKMTEEDLKLEAEVVSVASQEEEIVVAGDNTDKTHSKENSRDFSFTEGAEDEVAVAIGTTLDKCADAIDALGLSSSNSSTHSFNKVSVASLQSEKDGEILPAVQDEDDIVSSDVASVKSEDDWQCVEDVSDEFAKAAHLLGSAMFQSDIATPSEEFGESFTSDLTSIPTLTSEISQVLLARWEKHLRQLHELGFLDDHVNVNALEHLEAANIGCSSDDEISVNAAVEHILKNKD